MGGWSDAGREEPKGKPIDDEEGAVANIFRVPTHAWGERAGARATGCKGSANRHDEAKLEQTLRQRACNDGERGVRPRRRA